MSQYRESNIFVFVMTGHQTGQLLAKPVKLSSGKGHPDLPDL